MRDKIVVTVEPSKPSERLDIAEAFQQVLDYLRLVELAASDKAHFEWKLEKATTNSPFTVVAYTPVGAEAAKHQQSLAVAQRRTQDGLKELARGTVPTWMRKDQRSAARRLTRRFGGGIGKMALRANEGDATAFTVNRPLAAKALRTLERADGIEELRIPAHTAFGEIEGPLLGVGTYRDRPAFWVRANRYDNVRCLLEREKLAIFGDEATIGQVWQNKRVRVSGKMEYEEGGHLVSMVVNEMHLFPAREVSLAQVLDPGFTGDFEPVAYLDMLHEGMAH